MNRQTATGVSLPAPYVWANLGLWLAFFVLITFQALQNHPPHPLLMALIRLGVMTFGFGLSLAVVWMLAHWRETRPAPRIVAGIVLSIAASLLYGAVNVAFFSPVRDTAMSVGETAQEILILATIVLMVFPASFAFYFAVTAQDAAQAAAMQLVEARAMSVDAQNRMLRYQLSPHFMFNALNALASLISGGQNERAERMVLALAGFLRASLDETSEKVTLATELEAEMKYLEIERIRFDGRLDVKLEATPEARRALVPPLILHPLLENAVKHGVARSRGPASIAIEASAADGRLQVAVTNQGRQPAADKPEGLGLGLSNVRERLGVIYGETARLSCEPGRDRYEARLDLPLEIP